MAMPARGSAAEGFGAVQSAIEAIFAARPEARASLTGIGICAPGPLDPVTGVILNPPNVPCWRGFPHEWIMTEMRQDLLRLSGAPELDIETFFTLRWARELAPGSFLTRRFIT